MNFSHLKCYIDENKYKRILLLGLGNRFRGDDQAGLILAEIIWGKLKGDYVVELIKAGTNPENYLDKVVEFKPDVVFIVDSADIDERPGAVKMVGREMIDSNLPSTHTFSPGIIEDYIKSQIACDVKYILIQRKRFLLGEVISDEVREGLEKF